MSKSVNTSVDGPVKDLEVWARATEQEIRDISAAMEPLQSQLNAARERLDLIRRLMGLAGAPGGPDPQPGGDRDATAALQPVRPGAQVEDHMEAILRESGEPMHIGALRHQLIDGGVPLPGRGDESNLIVRLRRADDRFVRTGRGMYGLTEWGIPAAAPSKTRKVRKKKKAASK